MSIATIRLAGVAIVALAAGAAQAQEATPDHWIGAAKSTLSRADVRAAAVGAAAVGVPIETAFALPDAVGRTRADVRAELSRALESGEYALINGEASQFASPSRTTFYAGRRR